MIRFLLAVAAIAGVAPVAAQSVPGPKSFGICAVCHKVTPDGRNGLGPNLYGVGNRVAGSLPGFAYSPAMKQAKIRWTRAQLTAFIANPQGKVPGTRMGYAGQKNRAEVEAIVGYLLSLK